MYCEILAPEPRHHLTHLSSFSRSYITRAQGCGAPFQREKRKMKLLDNEKKKMRRRGKRDPPLSYTTYYAI